jgi:hypothetical protein
MLEDKLLIWKFKRGSRAALERIYEKYELFLVTVATALSNNVDVAEDVVHDFFLSFVAAADKLKVDGNLKAYLSKVDRHGKKESPAHDVFGLFIFSVYQKSRVLSVHRVRRLRSQETTPIPMPPSRRAPGAGITDGALI